MELQKKKNPRTLHKYCKPLLLSSTNKFLLKWVKLPFHFLSATSKSFKSLKISWGVISNYDSQSNF